MRVKLV